MNTLNLAMLSMSTGGAWGRVCYDVSDFSTSAVVCCQLGYSTALYIAGVNGSEFGQIDQSVPTWLSYVHCSPFNDHLARLQVGLYIYYLYILFIYR